MSNKFGNEDLLWEYWYSVIDDILKTNDDLSDEDVMKKAMDWISILLDKMPVSRAVENGLKYILLKRREWT